MPSGEPIRLIAGMPRSGTTWLCQTLNEHPDCVGFGQTEFWAKAWVEPGPGGVYDRSRLAQARSRLRSNPLNVTIGRSGPGWMRSIDAGGVPALVDGALPDESAPLTPGEAFARVCDAVARAEGKRCAIEKTPGHVQWLDRIMAHAGDARVIALIRDPYAFMLSYKHQGDRKDAAAREFFRKRYHPLGAAIVWRSALRRAESGRSRWPERVMIVRAEDMEREPRRVLEEAQRFLGLRPVELAEAIPRVNSSFATGPKPSLAPADIFWMNRAAGRAIRRAGYAITPTPRRPGAILKSAALLPVWCLRAAREISRRVGRSGVRYALRHLVGPGGGSAKRPGVGSSPSPGGEGAGG